MNAPDAMPEAATPPRRSRAGCAGWAVAALAIVAALTAFIFHRIETWPERTARGVRDSFVELTQMQPRVTVRDRVFFEQSASVLELATVSQPVQVERELEHEWLGSRKRLRLRGVYQVKAGFDLTKPFRVQVEGQRVAAEVPPPRILSVDPVDVEVLAFENGLWNRINAAELEEELRGLPALARGKAGEAGLQKEALERFTQQLREKLAPRYEVEVRVATPVSAPPRD